MANRIQRMQIHVLPLHQPRGPRRPSRISGPGFMSLASSLCLCHLLHPRRCFPGQRGSGSPVQCDQPAVWDT
ncbi:hypothetical protein BDW59DRAFT_134820 [Aspergillus cavernicola]|uniref:Uncharacterized protein n=1 Tax=Aspergillus cavernicola TaxID=176166 RepID=A0ABR4HP55_9EURO